MLVSPRGGLGPPLIGSAPLSRPTPHLLQRQLPSFHSK